MIFNMVSLLDRNYLMVCFPLSKEMPFIPSQQAEMGNRDAYTHTHGCVFIHIRTPSASIFS